MILVTFDWRAGPQLWRLNTLGRLRLVDDALPISSSDAKATIGAGLERLGLSRFPRASGTSVGQHEAIAPVARAAELKRS
jgi:hypothetical protein